jgi:type II secretory pathway pseudopilin PulG
MEPPASSPASPPLSPPPLARPAPLPTTSGWAIAGFVCAFLFGVLGIIFSAIALSQIGKSNGRLKGKGLAIAGLVISIVVMVIGLLAAISIPAFTSYMQKSKTASEAKLQLRRMSHGARAAAGITDALPVGEAPPTPAERCCTKPGGRCAFDAAAWRTPAWEAIEFEGPSEGGSFQYSYRSTAERFVATAVGDLDCDGAEISYTITVDLVNGVPTVSEILTSGRD